LGQQLSVVGKGFDRTHRRVRVPIGGGSGGSGMDSAERTLDSRTQSSPRKFMFFLIPVTSGLFFYFLDIDPLLTYVMGWYKILVRMSLKVSSCGKGQHNVCGVVVVVLIDGC